VEENKNSAEDKPAEVANTVSPPPQVATPINEKPKHSKKFKASFIFLAFLGGIIIWFGMFIAPTLLEKIDPISKLNEANTKACTSECMNSNDTKCVNICLESKGSLARITQAKIEPTITPTASPTPTLTPVPTLTKKITSVPKSTPTPAGNPTLVIRVDKGVSSVTLLNQSTGKTTTESISSPGKNYYVDPGAYRITFNEVSNCKASYSVCYENCSLTSGNWGWDESGNTANVNVEAGKTHAASLFYVDPSSSTNPGIMCKALQ
jgi:hypothetical protein